MLEFITFYNRFIRIIELEKLAKRNIARKTNCVLNCGHIIIIWFCSTANFMRRCDYVVLEEFFTLIPNIPIFFLAQQVLKIVAFIVFNVILLSAL